eukprot:snap_masked-scaffold_7-processed-gene-18.35-mRNA-1 protein AED:0.28 eAED:0.28 QI:0/-1/0/1/-1/1/1/0/235
MPEASLDYVKSLKKPTQKFLCSLSDNTYGVDFLSFTIKDYDTKDVIFKVDKNNPNKNTLKYLQKRMLKNEDAARTIRYDFSANVLLAPAISTKLIFSVGTKEIQNFRMIERHYFRNKLVKSYDFKFGFCIPGSVNTWEAIYKVPKLPDSLIEKMIAAPYETKSDSFYFVNGELIMHNKAEYRYINDLQPSRSLHQLEEKQSYYSDVVEEKKSNSRSPRHNLIETIVKTSESKAAF